LRKKLLLKLGLGWVVELGHLGLRRLGLLLLAALADRDKRHHEAHEGAEGEARGREVKCGHVVAGRRRLDFSAHIRTEKAGYAAEQIDDAQRVVELGTGDHFVDVRVGQAVHARFGCANIRSGLKLIRTGLQV